MKEDFFRKESRETINSPDQLNKYLRVPSVSVWLWIAVAAILMGIFFAWCFFGSIETTQKFTLNVEGGYAYFEGEETSAIYEGMTVRVEGEKYTLVSSGDWLTLEPACKEGVYEAEAVLSSVHPAELLWE